MKHRLNKLKFLKSSVPYLGVLLLFIAIASAYFVPASFEGRKLFQVDGAGASGIAQDVRDYNEETGEISYWTNSLFGGMPMYQIAPTFPSAEVLESVSTLYSLRFLLDFIGDYPYLLFLMMLGFFLLLKSLDIGNKIAVLGSLAWCFSSYFIILIVAGHIWKLMTLAFIPPTIAGFIWVYKGRYLRGAFFLSLFTALQLHANHIQMTYYFLFVMMALFIGWGIDAYRNKTMKAFFKATGVVLLAGCLGIATNTSKLYHTYTYAQETNRGGSELVDIAQKGEKKGFDKDYITQWSYGKVETLSLLIPNIRGGASESLAKEKELLEEQSPMYRPTLERCSSYWGEQPFTAGPVYVGVIVFILFLLSCCLLHGVLKWSLLSVTILAILLSWGHNFMFLTDFFIDYFPMYDKFRAVSSILVIVEFTIPILAILGFVEFLKDPSPLFRNKKIFISIIILPISFLFLVYLFPSFLGNGLSNYESEMFRSMAGAEYIGLKKALMAIRLNLLSQDALRSLILLSLFLLLSYFFYIKKLPKTYFILLVSLLAIGDLWMIDKRYLNDDHFIPSEKVEQMAAPKTQADELILADKDLGYRVWNRSVNSFNDASTSRWHRSIGGYHAAKLQRYQDLIEHQLMKGNEQVINMLNTRYIIYPNQNTGEPTVAYNKNAFGSAWFVKEIKQVNTAQEEMDALNREDLRATAIINRTYEKRELPSSPPIDDVTANIKVQSYTPNKIVYHSSSTKDLWAVFSEIYYPYGWKAYIDGEDVDIFRANYVLRSLFVPQGEHTITFQFAPSSIVVTEIIARLAIALLFLLLSLIVGKEYILPYIKKNK